ncbi:MAG TPA: protein-disulfide reductase DsbD domain-containing protein [Sphingomicrobium sp.]|nr:protein-disulfide reductase DsbD domain-containing protein [Sphingomicrobium sp.]
MKRLLIVLLFLLLAPAAAKARGVEPELVAEGEAPPGGEVELAIHMRPSPGWHGYWLNPGDAGLPMDVKWQLPAGVSVGPLRYPVPSRLEIAGLMNYVYEEDYAVLVRLKVPGHAAGNIPIRAEAHWLACTDKICVPEEGELSLDLPVGNRVTDRAQFDSWRQKLPQPLASLAHFETSGDKLRVAIPLPASVDVQKPYLFPMRDGPVDYVAKQDFERKGDTLIAELQRKGPAPAFFPAVIALGNGRGLEFRASPGPVPRGQPIGSLGWKAAIWAVLGAIMGGILLNLMPCVFPILALKTLHISRAGGEGAHARSDALAYWAGAIAGTGALGAVLLLVRAAGSEAGWAFQLQDPRTIMLLLLLGVAITANLVGLFELPVLGGAARPAGSFGTGALAAFVATPCAGPFLGAALGTALLLPAAGSILVFAALGLGLGLPFVAIAFIPSLRNRLPRPGPWMRRLQRFLAIPMALSTIAALWLLYRQASAPALLFGIFASLALLACLYFAGRMQRQGTPRAWVAALFSLVVVVAAVGRTPVSPGTHVASLSGAEPWSEARAALYVREQKPVFVYFTADWCLSCKVNEATSIDRDEVRDAFSRAGVKVLAADWTNGDPTITRFLESQGRAGVPLYLWYAPGKPVEQLPQVLTPAMLISRAQAQLKR